MSMTYVAIFIEKFVCPGCGVAEKKLHEVEGLAAMKEWTIKAFVRDGFEEQVCDHCDGSGGHQR